MNDEKLAKDIYDAAKVLSRALNAAGKAGLGLSVEFKPYESCHYGSRLVSTGNWRPSITVKRELYLDAS